MPAAMMMVSEATPIVDGVELGARFLDVREARQSRSAQNQTTR